MKECLRNALNKLTEHLTWPPHYDVFVRTADYTVLVFEQILNECCSWKKSSGIPARVHSSRLLANNCTTFVLCLWPGWQLVHFVRHRKRHHIRIFCPIFPSATCRWCSIWTHTLKQFWANSVYPFTVHSLSVWVDLSLYVFVDLPSDLL